MAATITRDSVLDWIRASAALIAENESYLTQLDADIGDADHGTNLQRGFQAVLAKLPALAGQDIGAIFKNVGMTLVSTVGGASGPLYGTFFIQMGAASAGQTELTLDQWTAALQAGVEGIVRRGRASPGDKTMLDALQPALESLKAAEYTNSVSEALEASARAAAEGTAATIPMVARKGRASYLGERSAGHQDPGATSSTLLLQAAARTLAVDRAG